MKKAQLSGSLRANVGKKDATALRNEGRVPCVLYGQGEQTHFSVRSVDLEKLIFSPDTFQIEIDIEGNTKKAVIKDKQMHPVTDKPVHIDFFELDDSKPVKLSLPLRTTGVALGVINGGRLRRPYRTLRVEGLPSALPDEILVDVTTLRIGMSIKVSDIPTDGFEIAEPQNAVVLSVKMARGAIEDELEEEEGEEGEEGAEGGAEGSTEGAAEGSAEPAKEEAPAEGGEE